MEPSEIIYVTVNGGVAECNDPRVLILDFDVFSENIPTWIPNADEIPDYELYGIVTQISSEIQRDCTVIDGDLGAYIRRRAMEMRA